MDSVIIGRSFGRFGASGGRKRQATHRRHYAGPVASGEREAGVSVVKLPVEFKTTGSFGKIGIFEVVLGSFGVRGV